RKAAQPERQVRLASIGLKQERSQLVGGGLLAGADLGQVEVERPEHEARPAAVPLDEIATDVGQGERGGEEGLAKRHGSGAEGAPNCSARSQLRPPANQRASTRASPAN